MRRKRRTPNAERRTTVDLEIRELVLHGFSSSEAQRVGAALEAELGRLLTERGMPRMLAANAEIPSVDAGRINRPATAAPEATGAELAKAAYGGLNHGQQ
jgi:hypothetical protein